MPGQLSFDQPDFDSSKLTTVYARFQHSEPFSLALFEGFSSLRVLACSVSTNTVVKMLNLFDTVECVFGFEGVLQDFSEVLARQKIVTENLMVAVQGLDDTRKQFILEQVGKGRAQFFVVKDAVAHAKIYLLEGPSRRRVMVGSANLSERAFSGKQAETILVFDDDDAAWEHYQREFEMVRHGAVSEISLSTLVQQGELALEDVPLLQEAGGKRKSELIVFLNTDVVTATVPHVIRQVERLAHQYKPPLQSLIKPKRGKVLLNREVAGRTIQLVRSQKAAGQVQEPTWFSIHLDTQRVFLTGREVPLDAEREQVQADVACLVEYFENFKQGFHGNVVQHQKDYFLFMCWLYFSPLVCDLRNQAIAEQGYIFDYPLFAVLYGKSNCGKTRLIETLLKSMFGSYDFVEKAQFTRTNLRDLLHNRKRYPAVFDDVEKKRFADHASDIIKDETFILEEYPAFVLSMNAEDHSFSSEIRKRCLILYTRASLPDNAEVARELYRSVTTIQNRITTALYHEYLKRVLVRLQKEAPLVEMLRFSSEVLTDIFREMYPEPLPAWCATVSMADYQGRKYEKIQAELLKLRETSPTMWEVRKHEVILRVPPAESFGLRKEIPDYLLKEGSKGGNIVLDRKLLEDVLGISFGSGWRRLLFGR